MSNLHKLKPFLAFGTSTALQKASALLILPLVAQALGPEDYGTVSYLLSVSGLLITFFMFAVDESTARKLVLIDDNQEKRKLYSSAVFFIMLSSIFLVGLVSIFSLKFSDHLNKFLLVPFSSYAVLNLFLNLNNKMLRASERSIEFLNASVGLTIVQAVSLYYFVVFLNYSVAGYFLSMSIGLLVSSLISTISLRDYIGGGFKKLYLDYLLRRGRKVTPHTLSSWFYLNFLIFWVGKNFDESITGNFAAMALFYNLVFVVSNVLMMVYQPRIYRGLKYDKFSTVGLYFVGSFLFLMSFSVPILAFSKDIFYFVFGKGFHFDSMVVYIFVANALYGYVNNILTYYMYFYDDLTNYLPKVTIASVSINVVFCVLLSSSYNLKGVVFSFFISVIFSISIKFYMITKRAMIPLKNILKVMAFNFLIVLLAFFSDVANNSFLIKIFFCVAISVIFLVLVFLNLKKGTLSDEI